MLGSKLNHLSKRSPWKQSINCMKETFQHTVTHIVIYPLQWLISDIRKWWSIHLRVYVDNTLYHLHYILQNVSRYSWWNMLMIGMIDVVAERQWMAKLKRVRITSMGNRATMIKPIYLYTVTARHNTKSRYLQNICSVNRSHLKNGKCFWG